MFGYVLPDKPELRIKEYETYRAYYCGVCKAIQRAHGNLPRLTLNYDITFLALLLSALVEQDPNFEMKRCMLHPLHKRKMAGESRILEYAGDMNVWLSYLNLKDKWLDDRSIAAVTGLTALRARYRKLKEKYPEKSLSIIERLKELSVLEQSKCNSIDEAAEPFARLMEEVIFFEPVCTEEKTAAVLKWIGYNTGKWIYTIDAFDDLGEDIDRQGYNPFIYQYEYRGQDLGDFKDQIREDVEFNLVYTLNEIAKGFELLDFKRHKDIAGNIIYRGMLKKTDMILGRGKSS